MNTIRSNDSKRPLALILGSTGGIGAAIALELAGNGFNLFLHHHTSLKKAEKLRQTCEKLGSSCTIVQANITRAEDIRALIRVLERETPHLDALINTIAQNATTNITKMTPSGFAQEFDTNVIGGAHLIQKLLPFLKKSHRARIILFSSIVAFIGSPRRTAYVTSKAGVVGLMHALSLELAPFNITVNAIVPSYIDTPRYHARSTLASTTRTQHIPLRRLGTPQEVASLVRFIASAEAAYITGQSLHINGGAYLT